MRPTALLFFLFFVFTARATPPNRTFTAAEANEIVTGMLFDRGSSFKHQRHYYHKTDDRIRLRIEGFYDGSHFEALVDEKSSRVFYLKMEGELVYQWKGIEVIAHRGAVRHAPENTIPAFLRAIELGADRIELDVRQTLDGHIVVIHDSDVDRTTSGQGKVKDMTLTQLKQLDAGSWFGKEFAGVTVPTLHQALEAIGSAALIEIDYKDCDLRQLVATLGEYNILYSTTIYVRDHDKLQELRKLNARLILKTIPPRGRAKVSRLMETIDPSVVNVKWLVYRPGMAAYIHRQGKSTCLNSLRFDNKILIDKMIDDLPDFLITNRLEYTLGRLRELGWHD